MTSYADLLRIAPQEPAAPKKNARGVLSLPRPSTRPPANLSNTTNLSALLCEEGNRKAYAGGRYKGAGSGQVNMSFRAGWVPAISETVRSLKRIAIKAAGENIPEDTILNCDLHVGIRYLYDHEDVRAFLTLKETFEESEIARDAEILDEYQITIVVRALQDFNPPLLPGEGRRNLVVPEFVHNELPKLGKLGLNVTRAAYFAILQGIDLQPIDNQHAAFRERIHSPLEDFYGMIRARLEFIYGGLQRLGAYDTYIRSVEKRGNP